MTQKLYSAWMRDEQTGDGIDIKAESLDEAWDAAVKWVRDGDYPDEGAVIELSIERLDDEGEVLEEREESIVVNSDEELKRDQNGNPVFKDVRQNSIDGLWYVNVTWGGGSGIPATMISRYGYDTQAQARDGDISDFNAASYHEPEGKE